jgi:hypothetical protein
LRGIPRRLKIDETMPDELAELRVLVAELRRELRDLMVFLQGKLPKTA